MSRTTYKGKILVKDDIIHGYVSVADGVIKYVGTKKPEGEINVIEGIIAPGFIDIHCHTAPTAYAKDSPEEVANYHLGKGTTTMLISYYRDIPHEELLECLRKTKEAMKTCKNIFGVHLEGPYVNPKYGCGNGSVDNAPDKSKYEQYVNSGIVKQWMCSPEVKGAFDFIEDITKSGIIPAVGHSEANYEQVKVAYEKGAKIVTHTFDATQAPPQKYEGTLEVDFNDACMLMDDMYYEVICDKKWIHVRKEKLALLIKTVGLDRVCAITDMYYVGEDDGKEDVYFLDGALNGTKLDMSKVAVNIFNAGYSLNEVFKMTSVNPAKALGLTDRGEIAVGKKADLIVIDENAVFKKVLINS